MTTDHAAMSSELRKLGNAARDSDHENGYWWAREAAKAADYLDSEPGCYTYQWNAQNVLDFMRPMFGKV